MKEKEYHKKSMGGTNFLVSIHHQDNCSWQGVIQWLDTGKTIHFRSALEMLSLIEEATEVHESTSKRSWDDIKHVKLV